MKQAKKLKELPQYRPGFLREMDRRTSVAVRLKEAFEAIVADAGGYKCCSHIKLSLIERYVFLEELLRRWESTISQNPRAAEDLIGKVVQASNSLQGLAAKLGIERSPAAVPGLKAYKESLEQRA